MEYIFFFYPHILFRNDFCCPYSCQMFCNYFWRKKKKKDYYSILLGQQNSALKKEVLQSHLLQLEAKK